MPHITFNMLIIFVLIVGLHTAKHELFTFFNQKGCRTATAATAPSSTPSPTAGHSSAQQQCRIHHSHGLFKLTRCLSHETMGRGATVRLLYPYSLCIVFSIWDFFPLKPATCRLTEPSDFHKAKNTFFLQKKLSARHFSTSCYLLLKTPIAKPSSWPSCLVIRQLSIASASSHDFNKGSQTRTQNGSLVRSCFIKKLKKHIPNCLN